MVGVGGWCAPKARARKAGLPKEMACRGIGVSQKPECPIARPQACPCNMKKPVTWMSSPAAKKVKHHGSVRAEGVKGAIADFVRFHCPLVASAEAIPPATKNTTPLAGESCCINKSTALLERPAVRSRSCARQYEAGRKSYLGSASADAQSYWQGRFAACAFVGDFLWSGRPRKSWGVAPNPTRELRPLTPQGGFPLDPFWRPSLSAFSLQVL